MPSPPINALAALSIREWSHLLLFGGIQAPAGVRMGEGDRPAKSRPVGPTRGLVPRDTVGWEAPSMRSSEVTQARDLERDQLGRRFETEALPHANALHAAALRLTPGAADAADLVQECFLRAFAGFGTFQSGTNIKAWLYRILMNTYISSYRKAVREPRTISADSNPEFSLYDAIADTGATPEAQLLDGLPDDEVREALDGLPEQFRIAVLLSDVEGFRYQEIADITGVSVGTVMSRLHRGRKALQHALWDYARKRGLVNEADPWKTPRRNAARS